MFMIIVTGGTGFVGRYLVDHLVKCGEEVIACGRSHDYDAFFKELKVPFFSIDITSEHAFEQLPTAKIDTFVHLAAIIPALAQNKTSDIFLRTNTIGTFYALEYCRSHNIDKFIYTTTLYECIEHTQLPITETMGRRYSLTGDHASYVISKIAACEYVDHYSQEYGLCGIILRFTGLLGYGRQEGFWSNGIFHPSAFEVFYKRAKTGEPIEIWGAHKVVRDSLYVKDAVRAIYAAIRSKSACGLYNIGSGFGRTNEDEARTFEEVFSSKDRQVPIVYKPEIAEKNKSYYFDIGKAKLELDWVPVFSYSDILVDYDKEVSSGWFSHNVRTDNTRL
ncbi:NAD(P)-dependent oxidoreductase [bacterium]|nr:MAG: NAD(P)-dependent oxidoreductase [bacterium]